jgi:hypothetical protein
MTASQPIWRRAAAMWRAARRAAAALRAIHDEQVLAWELSWQSGRVAVERTGPLTWTPSLDGPRLTGSHLPIPGDTSARNTPGPASRSRGRRPAVRRQQPGPASG